ncbi:amidohydrolase family protein [Pontibacter pamirensis]|uniref:amidohydrolase family protein n=1 Tax=Pontibacter pamirensis TaxID=2562824 RepID=UPI00138A5E54|nr:amidohydrolase family protein [Pontibacter pamirensis]
MKNLYWFIIWFQVSCTPGGITEVNEYDLVIENVGLIDGTGSALQEKASLYVRDGKIALITKIPLRHVVPKITIDGTGKFIIPGLIEAHAHPSEIDVDSVARKDFPHSFKTMIHYGVTSAVLLGSANGGYALMKELQESSNNGSMVAPRIHYSSPILTIEGGHPVKMYPSDKWIDGQTIYYLKETTPISSIIREAKANRAIGMKIVVEDGPMPPFGDRMADDLVKKVVEEAHAAEVPVYAHVSDMEEVKICVAAGVDNLVHFTCVRINWDTDRETIEKMRNSETSWVTTLMLLKSLVYYRLHPEWLERPEITRVYNRSYIEGLKSPAMDVQGKNILKGMAGSDTLSLEAVVTPVVQDLMKVQEMGVNVVLGTDVGGDRFILPGLSMHEEMELMQMGGMEPLHIIRMATFNGAKMLGIDKEIGTLEEGKFADFVLLAKNPLQDITNTLTIEKVFKGGKEQARLK